jgi:hypothetical protein
MSLFTAYILGITVIKVGKLWTPTEAKREQGVSIPLVTSVLGSPAAHRATGVTSALIASSSDAAGADDYAVGRRGGVRGGSSRA